MIHVEALDFSEWHSEEVIKFLFMLSVHAMLGEGINLMMHSLRQSYIF